mgnify:CR=1 FL=1
MQLLSKLEWAVTHPLTAVAALIGVLAQPLQLPFVDALVGTLWTQAGTLFAGVSLLPQLGAPISSGTAQLLMGLAGMLWLARILDRLYDGLTARLNTEDNS